MFIGLLIFIGLIIIRPQDFVPGLQGSRLVLIVMGTLLVMWFFSPIDKRIIRTGQDRFVVLFLGAIILSTITLFWIPMMIEMTVETVKLGLIYLFLTSIVDTEVRLRRATWILVILMAVVAAMGILQSFGMDITGAGMFYAADKGVWQIRGIGNFDNPNDLAYSVVLIVPFVLGYLLTARNLAYRIGAMFLLYLAIYCIYLTKSRGGLVALGSCLISWGYFWITSEKLKKYARIGAILGIVAVFAVQSGGYRDDASAMGRVEAWSAGWSMLKTHPLIGVGKDRFIEFHKRDSHNSYVRAGAELGIIGLYAFVGILYFSLSSLFFSKTSREDPRWRLYTAGYTSYIISFMAASAFSTRTYDIVFLCVVALNRALYRLSTKGKPVSPANHYFEIHLGVLNRNVFIFTILVLAGWYVFLRQVW